MYATGFRTYRRTLGIWPERAWGEVGTGLAARYRPERDPTLSLPILGRLRRSVFEVSSIISRLSSLLVHVEMYRPTSPHIPPAYSSCRADHRTRAIDRAGSKNQIANRAPANGPRNSC